MARVNHKLVKERLNEKRSKITDRQFFTSRLLAGHFEDMAEAQTRRYKYNRRVHVNLIWEPENNLMAMTDNRVIVINCGNKFITNAKGRETRYQIVCGFFAHELGHVLYTDFLADQTHINLLGQKKWFPEKPVLKTNADIRNEAALWDYVNYSEENMKAVQYVASEMSNIIEDGYIEDRMLINFPGTLKYGLESLRDVHFKQMPTVTELNRINSVDEYLVDQFNQIAPPLLAISKQLKRSIMRQFDDYRRGGKQTGLMMGRRLEVRSLPRNDGKVFSKNALPNEIPELSVGLLLDESGSMSCSDRCTYARAAAIILHDFCESLDIPIMIYGHSTGCNSVQLHSYAEFDGFDNDDKYRLMDIHARGSNRDGAALRFVAERLSKRSEDVKILILVSDGQPADTGYSGTAAEEDLRGIKQEYQRKGVLFVAAAIGEDKENIERIYGNSFLDITDLSQLPIKLTSIIKKHLKF